MKKMKKRLCFPSALLLALFLAVFSAAAEGGDGQTGTETTRIRVGFFQFSGYHEESEDGRRSGYGYDFLQKIGNYMDCVYEYVGYEMSYSDVLDLLERGEVDVVTSVSKTPEREKKFLFSDRPIGTNSTMFTVKAGNESVIAGDYSTYDGLKIGMLEGNSKNENFEKFAGEKGFSFEPVYFETETELTGALQDGVVDGVVSGSLRATKNEWLIESLDAADFYITVRKDRPDLMELINGAIAQLDLDEPDWRTSLHREHYSVDDGGLIMLGADERAYLQELTESGSLLRILVNPDRRPYSYFEDGKAKGIIPMIFEEISRKLALPYEIVETDSREEYTRIRGAGEADVVLDFASDYYLAEREGYRITDSYINTGFTCLTRSNSSGEIRTVASLKYADVLNSYVHTLYDEKSILYFDDVNDCVNAVTSGRADATILYTYAAESILQDDVRNRLSFVIMGDTALSYAIGVNVRGGYLLRSILNKAVASFGNDERQAIVMRETESGRIDRTVDLLTFIYDNPVYGILAVLFLCLFAFSVLLLVFRFRNQKQLRLRIADVSGKYEAQKLELQKTLDRAEAASQSKSVFLFNMSHDIRTPMNAIINFADIAEKHLNEPEVVGNAIRKIRTSSNILLKLINDVLDLARIESGKTTLDLTPQNMLEDERSIQLLFNEDMKKAGIEFVVEHEIRNPYVLYDCLRMNQISINLLSNARKFTQRGGKVVYSIRQLGEAKDGRAVYQLRVSDNGIGMSEEFQGRLFERFERERTSTVSGIQGTGLGLSIVKRIVDMMNGTIEVRSRMGEGTEFILTFSLQVVDEEQVSRKHVRNTETMDFTGRRILLVEDNEINREIAVELLTDEGFEVEEAQDGTVAVEKVAASEPGYYDVVLMDIQMPVMDGYQATREIRRLEDPQLAGIPIVAMTANAFEEDRRMAFEAGMNGHLAKPIEVGDMLDMLQMILAKEGK